MIEEIISGLAIMWREGAFSALIGPMAMLAVAAAFVFVFEYVRRTRS